MRYFAPLCGLLLLSAAAVGEPAAAQPNRAREGVQSGEVRSLDEILNGIRRERPGRLADVEGPNVDASGEPHYRLKWLTPDGRVLWLDTDARTGRVRGVQGDDRRPGPGATPSPRQTPNNARGAQRNFGAPPDSYAGPPRPPQFGQPGGPPGRFRPSPSFRGGPPDGGFRGPPQRQDFRGGVPPDLRQGPPPRELGQGSPPRELRQGPPPREFRPGPPPRELRQGPPPREFNGPPRGGFRQQPSGPPGGFNRGSSFSGGVDRPVGRMPEGDPRGPRRFR